MITQIFIMIFGASAIWFVSRKEDWKRWGYILGMLGQPFLIYESYTNEQWGILLMTLVYAYSWMQGIWNYWILPGKARGITITKRAKPEPEWMIKRRIKQENCEHKWRIGVCEKCGKSSWR